MNRLKIFLNLERLRLLTSIHLVGYFPDNNVFICVHRPGKRVQGQQAELIIVDCLYTQQRGNR